MKSSDGMGKFPNRTPRLTPSTSAEEDTRRRVPGSGVLHRYSVMQFEYLNSVFSQDIERVIRLISYNPQLFYYFRSQPIYMLISETVRILMMSLVEVIVYCEVLLHDIIKHSEHPADVFLVFVGFSVKKYFSPNLRPISEYLNTKFLNFIQNFENWEKTSGLNLKFNIKELNALFKKHRKGTEGLNLSYYIDRVLQISPPYQIESKEILKFILSDFEDHNKDKNFDSIYEKISSIFTKYEFMPEDKPILPTKPQDPFLLQISNSF